MLRLTPQVQPSTERKIKINGKYFCFDQDGKMQTGLQRIAGHTYYFDDNGYMKTGKTTADDDNDVHSHSTSAQRTTILVRAMTESKMVICTQMVRDLRLMMTTLYTNTTISCM